jgi:hypothetical protein
MIAQKLIVGLSLLGGGCAALPVAIMAGGASTSVKGIVDDASQDADILTLKERIKHLENKLNETIIVVPEKSEN